jgi:hypothetical protein
LGFLVPGLDLNSKPNSSSGLRNQSWFEKPELVPVSEIRPSSDSVFANGN